LRQGSPAVVPRGYAFAHGQQVSIEQNAAL
jgi:hypothetical protein